jgi:hypothetical protein
MRKLVSVRVHIPAEDVQEMVKEYLSDHPLLKDDSFNVLSITATDYYDNALTDPMVLDITLEERG